MCLFAATLTVAQAADKPMIESAKQKFAKIVAEQLDRNISPGFSVAWVVDGNTVHVAGYGKADLDQGTPASGDTIYRAGSISKLFNAIGAMQLVEQGKLDLDAPIQQALPEFRMVVPFADPGAITIRELLCHRSGMVREAPVGGYLDPSQPTVKATVASVADCVLVNNPPNPKPRYSNVGPTIVGRAVEVQTGIPFSEYQQQQVLEPLGMTSSVWLMNDKLRPRLAKAKMRVARADGTFTIQNAPQFELGTTPAGNLYTTASDLAKFAAFLMSGDDGSRLSPPIITFETLKEMSTPQLTKDSTSFGLGFFAGEYRNHKTLQHSGAVYGFSTLLCVLPRENIGIAVLSNSDISSGPVRRLADASLDLLLEAVKGEAIPPSEKPIEVSADDLEKFVGEFESQSYWCKLAVVDGKLMANLSTQPLDLTPVSKLKFLAEGRIMTRGPFEFAEDEDGRVTGFQAVMQKFTRVNPKLVQPAPEHWQQFVGAYGSDFIPLVISIRNGHLYALAENEYDYRLEPINRVTFRSPPGMYDEECIVFQTTPDGKPVGAIMFNMYLPRRVK
ncbi:MAG: beta-lactamase family protein [Pirellulales bacterium]|nr:beta-lactamase family protein [Pirellulales bacterium]